MSKNKSIKKLRISRRDIVFYTLAFILTATGLFFWQRQEANEERANTILEERRRANIAADEATANPCQTTGQTHRLVFRGGNISPAQLTVQRCDVIVLDNQDANQTYNMNFGEHSAHQEYLGYTARDLAPGQTQAFVATTTGSYLFHDHYRDVAHLQLTVTE